MAPPWERVRKHPLVATFEIRGLLVRAKPIGHRIGSPLCAWTIRSERGFFDGVAFDDTARMLFRLHREQPTLIAGEIRKRKAIPGAAFELQLVGSRVATIASVALPTLRRQAA